MVQTAFLSHKSVGTDATRTCGPRKAGTRADRQHTHVVGQPYSRRSNVSFSSSRSGCQPWCGVVIANPDFPRPVASGWLAVFCLRLLCIRRSSGVVHTDRSSFPLCVSLLISLRSLPIIPTSTDTLQKNQHINRLLDCSVRITVGVSVSEAPMSNCLFTNVIAC